MRNIIYIFILFSFFGYCQNKGRTCETNKDLCLETYLLKWRGTYTIEASVAQYTFPDQFKNDFDGELLDSIYSNYDLKAENINRDNFKRIYSRFNHYDLKKHFNENQKITFLDTLQIKKPTKVFRRIEAVYFQEYYSIIQYSIFNF